MVDFFATTLEPDEMIVEVRIPALAPWLAGSYVKFVSRSGDDRTCLGVAAFTGFGDDGSCRELRLAVIGAGVVPLRLPEVEAQVAGQVLDARAIAVWPRPMSRRRTRCRMCAVAPATGGTSCPR